MTNSSVESHYSKHNLIESILTGLEKVGKTKANVSVDDLAPVDEFHTGGRAATEHLLGDVELNLGDQVLDIGCGIGGTGRYLADRFNVKVHGIDLTSEYVSTGKVLNSWVGLEDQVELQCDDATTISSDDSVFDMAIMLHVGMNIEDKYSLFSEVARVLKSGGQFAIYDVLRKNDQSLNYPVPWATDASMSFLESLELYTELLGKAGFTIEKVVGRGEFAKSFFKKMQATAKLNNDPPAMGLHLLVGASIKEKMKHFSEAIYSDVVEPTEIIARKL